MYIRVGSYNQLDRKSVLDVIEQKLETDGKLGVDEATWLIEEVKRLNTIIEQKS